MLGIRDIFLRIRIHNPYLPDPDPTPELTPFFIDFAGITSVRSTHVWEKGRIRSRIRIREAQKHADLDPVPDPDPHHCQEWNLLGAEGLE